MRIVIDNCIFHAFKSRFYIQTPHAYFYNPGRLHDKFFTTRFYRNNKYTMSIINALIASPEMPEMISAPSEVKVSLDEQFEDLINFLETDYNIHMDDRNRFYANVQLPAFNKKKNMFGSTGRNVTIFFSWQEILGAYNEDIGMINGNQYLSDHYRHIKQPSKSFVYVDIKRLKSKGFVLGSGTTVTMPK